MNNPLVTKLIELAILEDLAGGDLTSQLVVEPRQLAVAEVVAREKLIFCGAEVLPEILRVAGASIAIDQQLGDGKEVGADEKILTLQGLTYELLALERIILNFLQHLSAIATNTRAMVDRASPVILCDTRKTTPGWRSLEKYAVRIGGARNHRMNLSDMILVKNNHIDCNGGKVELTLEKVFKEKPIYTPVEVEVRTLAELNSALEFPIDVVMLDNMNLEQIRDCLAEVSRRNLPVMVEVSGRMNSQKIQEIGKLSGITCISTSSLAMGRSSIDISMRIQKNG